jgi:response regulator NasT
MPESSPRPLVLLVDDDRLVLATLGSGLRQAGYEVIEAANGHEALLRVRERTPDLALVDVRMPEVSGIELTRQLQANADVPVLFLSAYSDAETVSQAAEHGALGYLVKPLDVTQIVPAIEAALRRAAEIRALKERGAQLQTALSQGREAAMAVGILMERFKLDRDDAFDALRTYARSERKKLRDVAAGLVTAVEGVNTVVPASAGKAPT